MSTSLIGLAILGLSGCENRAVNEAKADQAAFRKLEQADLSTDIKKEEIEAIVQSLPAPSEIPVLLRKSGAGFNPGLLNDFSRIEAYRSTSFTTSLNLWIRLKRMRSFSFSSYSSSLTERARGF